MLAAWIWLISKPCEFFSSSENRLFPIIFSGFQAVSHLYVSFNSTDTAVNYRKSPQFEIISTRNNVLWHSITSPTVSLF